MASNSNPNLDLTLRAISVFNTGSGNSINEANVWLTGFERTSEAWVVASELIHGGRETDAATAANNQFWGLKILYAKVKRDFHQIDIGTFLPLLTHSLTHSLTYSLTHLLTR